MMGSQDDWSRDEIRYIMDHLRVLEQRVLELERLLKKEEK